ncbi:methyltransferase domain-containing protein [Shewanella yunxiaonensis]|uniref:tRNA 5-carboxymethoxyuridine methyltransferase n=1 Tax=Shewanella yunxiaonensis TaxID=2829809 RepID=A0ABX7YZ98_9GAMM|nr:methyltransferase domain-containing protein [Shewanella yunxiaonensis]QUN07491.1 methyltransferase domain-containing protein [Shewanella yunxiaonensis]
MQDKNFDKLAQKFAHNIYGTTKGDIRMAVLWRDLQEQLPLLGQKPLRILDAGGGFGYFSLKLAQLGHQVVLCDISEAMLQQAQQLIDAEPSAVDISLVHAPIQELKAEELGQFDLILCHAVAEWLADAKDTLQQLLTLLQPSGLFSLMFYNKEAMRFHALTAGNFDYVRNGLKSKKKNRLSPEHPLEIPTVRKWFDEWSLTLRCASGVRVIHDYMNKRMPDNYDERQLIDIELEYSRREPYLSLGRYIHFIGHKH